MTLNFVTSSKDQIPGNPKVFDNESQLKLMKPPQSMVAIQRQDTVTTANICTHIHTYKCTHISCNPLLRLRDEIDTGK
jgi:hypothetical protein